MLYWVDNIVCIEMIHYGVIDYMLHGFTVTDVKDIGL